MATRVQRKAERQQISEGVEALEEKFPMTYYAVPIRTAHRRALDRYNTKR